MHAYLIIGKRLLVIQLYPKTMKQCVLIQRVKTPACRTCQKSWVVMERVIQSGTYLHGFPCYTLIFCDKVVYTAYHCFLMMFVYAVNQTVAFNKFYVPVQNKLHCTRLFSFSDLTSNQVAIINSTKQTLYFRKL